MSRVTCDRLAHPELSPQEFAEMKPPPTPEWCSRKVPSEGEAIFRTGMSGLKVECREGAHACSGPNNGSGTEPRALSQPEAPVLTLGVCTALVNCVLMLWQPHVSPSCHQE